MFTKNESHDSCLQGACTRKMNATNHTQDSRSDWWGRKRSICLCARVREAVGEEGTVGGVKN